MESYGVIVSEWKTSRLISKAIDQAKERNLLNAYTFSLLYASDFADRLENVIIPALKAGLIVLTDRYTYTAFSRDVVRGVSPKWIRELYSFAPKPDLVFYLKMPVEMLLK
ncbi:MAG: dTMP kinase, partial [Promethearchaeia archaeon]